jgi:acyl carrier protein
MSAVFGTGGQGNYASANSFLDALASYRRGKGLPGLSVSWGFLGETGFVSRHPEVAQRFEAMGVRSFTALQGLSLLGRFLEEGRGNCGVMKVEWRLFKKLYAGRELSLRFAHLVDSSRDAEESGKRGSSALRHALLAAEPAQRRTMLSTALQEQVARVLGVPTDKLDLEKPLSELGLDSLMAIELRNWVEGDLRLSLPAVELLKGPSVLQIADKLLEQFGQKHEESGAAAPGERIEKAPSEKGEREQKEAAELLSKVDEMSDQQVDELLGKLDRVPTGRSE